MIRMEYPKFNIEGLRDSEKLSTIKRQLDTLTNNIQLVLESISGDVETLSEFVGNNNEAENSENISTITESITSITETIGELEDRDYIVDQGTSGVWTYRKWNSGMAECWCSTSTSSLTWTAYMASPSVNPYLYYSSGWNFNLPFAMTDSSYVINATCLVAGPNFGWVARGSKTTSSFILYIIRNGNSGSCGVDVSVKGRWK